MGRVPNSATPGADLWHHYGRTRAVRDGTIPESFHWNWTQNSGRGTEVLGDVAGCVVGDLGAGAARHPLSPTTSGVARPKIYCPPRRTSCGTPTPF